MRLCGLQGRSAFSHPFAHLLLRGFSAVMKGPQYPIEREEAAAVIPLIILVIQIVEVQPAIYFQRVTDFQLVIL